MVAPKKKRVPYGIHEIWKAEVGKPYRGDMVKRISMDWEDKDDGRTKVIRVITLGNGGVLTAESWHNDREELFEDGKIKANHEIHVESSESERKAPDHAEKKKRREALRLQAREMMSKSIRFGTIAPTPLSPRAA